jgi:hypothetical protein
MVLMRERGGQQRAEELSPHRPGWISFGKNISLTIGVEDLRRATRY